MLALFVVQSSMFLRQKTYFTNRPRNSPIGTSQPDRFLLSCTQMKTCQVAHRLAAPLKRVAPPDRFLKETP